MASEFCETRVCEVHWVGLDVSKVTFDAALVRMGQKFPSTRLCDVPARSFERNCHGVECFLGWLSALTQNDAEQSRVRVAMEATGKYSIELAVWLLDQQPSLQPAIVCPSHTAAFIKSLGLRNKTDRLEARALAFYGVEREPVPYEPPTPELAELQALSRYRDTLGYARVPPPAIGPRKPVHPRWFVEYRPNACVCSRATSNGSRPR